MHFSFSDVRVDFALLLAVDERGATCAARRGIQADLLTCMQAGVVAVNFTNINATVGGFAPPAFDAFYSQE
eukprot:562471-Prorocentrum_minimum.AAC.1